MITLSGPCFITAAATGRLGGNTCKSEKGTFWLASARIGLLEIYIVQDNVLGDSSHDSEAKSCWDDHFREAAKIELTYRIDTLVALPAGITSCVARLPDFVTEK